MVQEPREDGAVCSFLRIMVSRTKHPMSDKVQEEQPQWNRRLRWLCWMPTGSLEGGLRRPGWEYQSQPPCHSSAHDYFHTKARVESQHSYQWAQWNVVTSLEFLWHGRRMLVWVLPVCTSNRLFGPFAPLDLPKPYRQRHGLKLDALRGHPVPVRTSCIRASFSFSADLSVLSGLWMVVCRVSHPEPLTAHWIEYRQSNRQQFSPETWLSPVYQF